MQYPLACMYDGGMSTQFSEWLREQMRLRDNMKQAELARRVGVAQSMVSRWVRGESTPEPENGRRLATVFHVREADVLRLAGHLVEAEAPPSIKPRADAVDLLEQALAVVRQLREERVRDEYEYEEIPYAGSVHAGRKGILHGDEPVYWRTHRLKTPPGRRRYVDVVGDCMAPIINDGDVVIVDPDLPWKVGQVLAVAVQGGAEVRKLVQMNGELVLRSETGDELRLHEEDTRIVGVVVGRQEAFQW